MLALLTSASLLLVAPAAAYDRLFNEDHIAAAKVRAKRCTTSLNDRIFVVAVVLIGDQAVLPGALGLSKGKLCV